jgi:hypothetical protein
VTRTILIQAGDFDRPVELPVIQQVDASWNGQTVVLKLSLVFGGQFEILHIPITRSKAKELLERLQIVLNDSE